MMIFPGLFGSWEPCRRSGDWGEPGRRLSSSGLIGSWLWTWLLRVTPRKTPRALKPCGWGGGVVISLGDFLESPKRGYFITPGLKELALKTSKEKSIPVQLQAIFGNSYTDTAAVSQEFSGVASISLGIPIRYSHAPSSVCHLGDIEGCLRLAEAMLRKGVEKKDLDFLR